MSAAAPSPLIRIEQVRKSFGTNLVLRDVSLDVDAGEVVVIAGRSGSGKSTLLRCINHLEAIDSGRICVAALNTKNIDYVAQAIAKVLV